MSESITNNERKRLLNLESYNLDNGYPKDQLQAIIKLASEICNTSVSLIDIIDQSSQRTIVTYGDWPEQEIPRERSICDNIVVDNEMLILNNVSEHPKISARLSDEDKEKIQFYAGAPLKSPEGYNLGALCVIDSEPKSLSEFQQESLQTLANEVMARLDLHRQANQLKQKNDKLEKYSIFLKNSADILCIIDSKTGEIEDVNDGAKKELDFSKEDFIGEKFVNFVASDEYSNREMVIWFKRNEKKGDRYSRPVQLKNKKGVEKWFRCNFSFKQGKWYLTARNITEQYKAELRNQKLQKKYEKLSAATSDLTFEYNVASDTVSWDEGLAEILGYSESQKEVDFEWWREKIHPKDVDKVVEEFGKVLESKDEYWQTTYRFKHHDGSYRFILGNAYLERDEAGKPEQVVGALSDITDLRKSELKEKRLLSRLNHANQMAELGYWEIDLNSGNVFWSDEIYQILEVDKESVKPSVDYILDLVDAKDRERINALIEDLSINEGFGEIEHKINIGNEVKYLYHRGELEYENSTPKSIIITTQDITDRKEKELRISESLNEKETLLSEIHHRVKNNLAVISGLLEMNTFSEEEIDVQNFIRNSQLRIQSMAKIHEQLYESKSFTHISFNSYLDELLETIEKTIPSEGTDVTIIKEIDDLELNINQAIPCGMICNELITNSLKHAFPDKNEGEIVVRFKEESGSIKITVKDNGIGLPDDFNPDKSSTFGMTLLTILSKQLGADINFDREGDGFGCKIEFEKKDDVKGSSSGFV